jgi:oligopeptide transport system substrate-binding protein
VVAGVEGNPFFIEELVKMLVEDGVIVKGEERWRVEPSRLSEVRVPPTLRGVLQARLDRLPIEDRTVLQQASVVGRLFWDQAVVRVSESAAESVEEGQVLDALSELRGREMVFQRETTAFAGAHEYVFKHAVLREVTYESLLKRLRRIYHGLVADWLMEQAGERVGEYTGLIADHLELAGRSEEAVGYLLEAGDRARGLYAHQEAVGAYERALALLKEQGDEDRAARTLMKLGLTYHTAFQFQRSRDAYEDGFALWQQAGEQEADELPPAPHALRIAWTEPPTIDPTLASDDVSCTVIEHLFSGLVATTPETEVVPDVAYTWEVLEEGRKYVFHLRDDVRWSDGVTVTAKDLEYAWKRVLDPVTESPNADLLYDVKGARPYHEGDVLDSDSVGVRALDDVTVVVELEGPTGYFPQLLAYNATYPVPQHVVEAHGEAWTEVANIVTNGPFRLETYDRGDSLILARNPRYHGRVKGNVERVELALVEEWGVRLQMYEANSLEVLDLWGLPAPERDRARQRHAGEYVTLPKLETFYAGFDVSRPPFDDPRARRAFVLATDREALADVALGGYEFPAAGGFIPPGMPGHSPGIGLPYDPSEAQRLLGDAGYPGGLGFAALEALTHLGNVPVAEYLRAQWRETIGIASTWETTDWASFVDRLAEHKPHVFLIAWEADYPDPDNFLRASSVRRQTRWRDEAYEKLVDEARRLTDQEERMRVYKEADRILVEKAAVIPLTYRRFHMLVKPWVRKPATSEPFWRFLKDVVIEPH